MNHSTKNHRFFCLRIQPVVEISFGVAALDNKNSKEINFKVIVEVPLHPWLV